MAPGWCGILLLLLGWVIAHALLHIPHPHWVKDGEFPILDALGPLAMLVLALSTVSSLAGLLGLPLALIAHWRVPTQSRRTQLRSYLILAVFSLPVLIEIGMLRPFGGLAWGLVDWIPD